MRIQAFTTAEAFIDYLRPSKPLWARDPTRPGEAWVFRGQSDAALPLVPRAFRAQAFEPYFSANDPKAGFSNHESESEPLTRFRYVIRQARAEIGILRDFIELADHIGLQPLVNEGLIRKIQAHETLLEELAKSQELPEFGTMEMPPQGLYDSFGLAQHYGLPTRFLDWSYSPLIASYFAARSAFDERDTECLAVWALNSAALFDFQRQLYGDKNWPLFGFTTPYSSNRNMYAQKGFFTVDRMLDRGYVEQGKWIPQDEVIEGLREASADAKAFLRKMTLPAGEAKALLRLLYLEGISPAHLMPSLETVEQTLRYRVKLFGAADAPTGMELGARPPRF